MEAVRHPTRFILSILDRTGDLHRPPVLNLFYFEAMKTSLQRYGKFLI